MSFVFLTVLQGKVQYKQCSGSHAPASARRSLLLLLPKALSLCYLFPPPPEGICLLLMAFLFSQGRGDTVRNVTVSQGFCSFVRPHKVEFPMAADSKRVLCSQPQQSGKKPGKLRIKYLSVV